MEVIPGFMRAQKGDPGYWIQARGTFGRFDQDDGLYVKERQLMPVFGVKKGDTLWYAHVKSWRFGYDFTVRAKDGAYEVYPAFRCDRVRAFFTNLYSDIVIDFRRLDGNRADNNGLAKAYQRYQREHGGVRTIKERIPGSPELAYLCEAPVVRIQTHAAKPIPDESDAKLFFRKGEEPPVSVHMPFGVAEEFLQALKDAGVDKLSVCSAGWQDGGYDGRVPGHFPVGAEAGGADAAAEGAFHVTEPAEKRLALQLLEFPGAVRRAAEAYKPSVLADYLFQTAQLYSSFYQNSPILKSAEDVRRARLRLVALFGKVLKTGLGLLGIETPRHI